MSDRYGPRTIGGDLVRDLWTEVKNTRDLMVNLNMQSAMATERLDTLLRRMKVAGMNDWIPTLEEVQAAWRGDDGSPAPEGKDVNAS